MPNEIFHQQITGKSETGKKNSSAKLGKIFKTERKDVSFQIQKEEMLGLIYWGTDFRRYTQKRVLSKKSWKSAFICVR